MYDIAFVGLACFSKKDGPGRLVLLPDGRDPGPDTDPHLPRLALPTAAIERIVHEGLEIEEVGEEERKVTIVSLPPCTLHFEGADTRDRKKIDLNTETHDSTVQRLSDIDPTFDADNEAAAVVKLRIRKGALEPFRLPGSEDEPDPAIVSRLRVPHDGTITVTIMPNEEYAAPATIQLKPETEIVIANTAPNPDEFLQGDHFLIYQKLSTREVDLSGRPTVHAGPTLVSLPTNHPFFLLGQTIGVNGDCGNTGCCP